MVDPFQQKIGDLNIVPVHHHHVAVAVEPHCRQVEHLGVSARRPNTRDKGLTILEGVLPGEAGGTGRCIQMVAEDSSDR